MSSFSFSVQVTSFYNRFTLDFVTRAGFSSLVSRSMMRMTRLLAVSMIGMLCSLYGQEPITVSSAVRAVTVYPDRARVTRTGTVTLPEGTSVLQFVGLPEGLEEDSVVVHGQSDAALTIEGIDIRNQFLAASALPRTQELQGQLRGLEDQKESFTATKGVLEEKRAFFRNLAAGLGKGEKEPVNVDEIKKLYTYYGDELSSVAENILSVERSEAKLEPEIDRVKRELEALGSGQQKSQRVVLVSVKTGASAKAEFTLSYVVGNASWTPSFDARVDSTTGKVELLYNALIRQKTTEDWSDVRLVLSTAQPGRNGRMPDLEPAFVDFKIPEPMPMSAGRASNMPAPMRAEAPAQADELALKSTNAEANVQTTGLAVAYEVELPVTIPADGQPHRTNVTLLNLQGGPEYVTTPKLDPGVFLRVHLVNTSPALLLPGPVSVFRDGEFTGTIPLSLLPAGGDFDLYVGQDDSIKAERKETVHKRSETGILNKREVEDRTYQISIQNFRANPIKLLMYDQLPVSETADVVVNQGPFSDKPATSDKDSGKLSWNIELGPKAKKVIEFSYSVEWPKGKEIAGGL
jgi:uncharacterized protein (TIGR02231 family)